MKVVEHEHAGYDAILMQHSSVMQYNDAWISCGTGHRGLGWTHSNFLVDWWLLPLHISADSWYTASGEDL